MPATKEPSPLSAKIFKTLGVLFLLLLLTAAGAGAGWFYANRSGVANPAQQSAAASTTENPTVADDAKAPAPIFLTLDPFTVTLTDGEMERILHVAITARLSDQESLDRLERYKPETRSRVLQALSEQSPESIAQPSARQEISRKILASLAQPFHPLVSDQKIQDILFTEFVVQ